MINRERIIKLYDIYQDLLTAKQKEYFENYYFEDLSLSEISENFGVSKSFVGKTISKVEQKLENYESTLKILELHNKINEIASITRDENTKKELTSLIN